MSEKMGAGLQDLLPRLTTDAMVDVLWSYDYEKGVIKVVEEVTLVGPQ